MRYIVEPKSRGFDVVDTTATPRADGFWCYCVDRERAQVIADKLNEAESEPSSVNALSSGLSSLRPSGSIGCRSSEASKNALGADGLNMTRCRANRRIESFVAPAAFFPSLHQFGNCFNSEDTIVMDLAACFSSAEANRGAVVRARSRETAPDATRQIFTVHVCAIEDDQP